MEEAAGYVNWEEVVVSNDKGRRVVHYYLRDGGGMAELAVVGREKSARHMCYEVPSKFLRSLLVKPPHVMASPSSSSSATPPDGVALKWKTRREVVEWLSSLVSDFVSYGSSPMMDRFSDDGDAEHTNIPTYKAISSGKMGHLSKEISWLGPAWSCRKRRKHYVSFSRNGVTVSVHDFVYVMAEDNRRLVAYVEDLYEDLRANNMVVVRWFHKIDEVCIALPPDVSDREIFFSLCLQDLSVECIDGLAAVLSPQDYEKFQNEAKQSTTCQPYLCRRQIDNDDIKPFDIRQVQGYGSQELLRSLGTPSLKVQLKITCGGSSLGVKRDARAPGTGPKKKKNTMSTPFLRKELLKQKLQHRQLALGSRVEVLSQDSGVRGCWFRCMIRKWRHDKVKVRYLDLQDAEGTGNLEEWILASRMAAPDKLGIHSCGRPIVRPLPSNRGMGIFNVGTIVDAWWNDGWWEGIVVMRESEGKLHVYFPGEKRVSVLVQSDLRHSQDWIGNKWSLMKDRPDIASSFSPALESKIWDTSMVNADPQPESLPAGEMVPVREQDGDVPNLAKRCQLDRLKWRWSKKKRHGYGTGPACKRRCGGSSSSNSSQDEVEESNASGGFVLPKTLTVEQEVYNLGRDPLFGAPLSLCPSLVMSQ